MGCEGSKSAAVGSQAPAPAAGKRQAAAAAAESGRTVAATAAAESSRQPDDAAPETEEVAPVEKQDDPNAAEAGQLAGSHVTDSEAAASKSTVEADPEPAEQKSD
uniref:Uncharacterized protein n=1 Tax=Macrostomum lignano TaxID=282301 RepID=A0A1I8HJ62_9PLAT